MDVLGTAVGIASFGVQVCQGLISYYDRWKDYHSEITTTYDGIADLARTFTVLKSALVEGASNGQGKARVEACLTSCVEGLLRLNNRLLKLRSHEEPQGLRQKTWAEMQRAWYPFRAKTIAKMRDNMNELRDNLALALQTLQQVTLASGFESTSSGISEILAKQQTAEDKISEVLSGQRLAQHRCILDWLSPPDPYYNHTAARRKHQSGTGDWLLQSDRYQQWKASSNDLLWFTGKAGCGKTVLCSTVIEDVRMQYHSTGQVQLAFFYFSFSDVQKMSYAAFLASLISQLSPSRAAFDEMQNIYKRIYPGKPSSMALEHMLSICLQHQESRQTILIMDALDELPESDNDDGRPAMLNWLSRTMDSTAFPNTKILITSRQVTDVETVVASRDAPCILLRSEPVDNDIRNYVAAELEKHSRLRGLAKGMKEKIKQVFEQRSDGMFRWAFCQLEMLKNLKSTRPKYVEAALNDLPPTLDATYERILLQIEDMYHDEALAALQWLTFALRPLTLNELAEACLINYMSEPLVDTDNRGEVEDILQILAGLVTVDSEDNDLDDYRRDGQDRTVDDGDDSVTRPQSHGSSTEVTGPKSSPRVRLAHFSVKEYLLSNRIRNSEAFIFSLQEDVQQVLAQRCLAYVLHYSQNSSGTSQDQFPFLYYASEEWTQLISKTTPMYPAHEITLLGSEHHIRTWRSSYDPDWPTPTDEGPNLKIGPGIYYASYFGLIHTCQSLLDSGASVEARGELNSTALRVASSQGHPEVVKLLLSAGADVNTKGTENYIRGNRAILNPTTAAHKVKRLLRDATVTSTCETFSEFDADFDTDFDNDPGTDFDIEPSSALQGAIEESRWEVVEVLLEAGADVNIGGGFFNTPLQTALWRDNPEVAKQLLDAGADVEVRDIFGATPLQIALGMENLEAARILLHKGADVWAWGGSFGDAISIMFRRGDMRMVQLILDNRTDIDMQYMLQTALDYGRQDVVQSLLDRGAEINVEDAYQAASANGHDDLMKLLLDRGTDGNDLRNALQTASDGDHSNLLQLLKEAGVDIGAPGSLRGESP